jgi:CHASE3 domain sensor protein
MEHAEQMTHSDHQLMDQERFEIGGRDTVIVVWSLIGCIVVLFSLLVY